MTRIVPRSLVLAALGWGVCGCENPQATVPEMVTAAPVPEVAKAKTDNGPLELVWEELEIPLGPEQDFEPWMISTAIKSLDGRQVRITGYMYEGVAQKSNIREFVLIKHVGCQFGSEGQPQHLVMVELQGKLRTSLTTSSVKLTGDFAVEPYTGPDGRVWALYRLQATSLEEGKP